MAGYDIIGNIAIVKFPDRTGIKEKKKTARRMLKQNKNIKTVLEKKEKVSGRLRTYKTRFLAGIKTLETIHNESGCRFKLDIEKCYFSPRLAGERLDIARKIKKDDKVLVLFAGVGSFSIVIARNSRCKKIVSVELGRECCKYARENVKLNKLDNVKIIQGNVKKLNQGSATPILGKFDKIIMPRPQLRETFLKYVWKFCKKGTLVFYYDFGKDADLILRRVENEAKKARKKIKIIEFRKAGNIAPYKHRWRVDLKIL